MERRYSSYTVEELRAEVAHLKEQLQKAEQWGNVSEYEILQRKMQMAAAYLVNPADFEKGQRYELAGDPGQIFEITYINGVFAWGGHRINLLGQKYETREAVPLSILGDKVRR
ncbi:transcription regulator [Gracilibacillus boraciitolerans JCM 21714]|uniref:Transcription regulator n=1 Tax=Gracilibacillus boraciitolerans JCM 21714 TaxID=1298598 RepID=W4VQH3_9BACI|nr:YfhH family protein [Gracilibacillus boraciitolerans]GAE95128.1 transcription regulator [Gracilibacillus boraciitolerans JCM 21714]